MADMCINILSESDLDRLADATLTVLERAGVMYQSDAVLDALKQSKVRNIYLLSDQKTIE